MRNKKTRSALVKVAAGLIPLALMILCLGCGRLLPTAPDTQTGYATNTEENWGVPCNPLSPEDIPFDWTVLSSMEDAGWFGPAGAVMTQVIDCVFLQFRVPPQALNESVHISVKSTLLARNLDGQVCKKLEFVFEPDGLVFSKPATLTFGTTLLGAKEGDQLTLRWFNPQTQSWEVVEKVLVLPGQSVAIFKISHFSRYAISCSIQPSYDK